MKHLLSALLLLITSNAFATEATIVAVRLNDVDDDGIQAIEFLACFQQPNVRSDCSFKIRIQKRNGQRVERSISSYAGNLINETRASFVYTSRDRIINFRQPVTCRMMPPEFSQNLYTYRINDNYESNFRIVLGADDCTRETFIRPATDAAYADARKVRELLLVLANESL